MESDGEDSTALAGATREHDRRNGPLGNRVGLIVATASTPTDTRMPSPRPDPQCAPAGRSRGGVLSRNVVICVFESMTEFETTRLHAWQSFYPSGPFPMRSTLRRASLVIFLLNVCGAWYIDPGAASLLWQLIVSGVIGVGFTLRHSITRLYRRLRRRENDAQ